MTFFKRIDLLDYALPAVSFGYSDSDSQEVSMNINRTGNKKHGGTFKCNSTAEVTPNQMRLFQSLIRFEIWN